MRPPPAPRGSAAGRGGRRAEKPVNNGRPCPASLPRPLLAAAAVLAAALAASGLTWAGEAHAADGGGRQGEPAGCHASACPAPGASAADGGGRQGEPAGCQPVFESCVGLDGAVRRPAPAPAAPAADPRGEGGAGGAGAGHDLLAKRWEIIDSVAVAGRAGPGQRIVVVGSTDRPDVPVSVRVDGPHGRTVSGSTILPDERTGRFIVDIRAGEAWPGNGTYSAWVEQRDGGAGHVRYSDLLELEVLGGAVVAQPRLAGSWLPPAAADSCLPPPVASAGLPLGAGPPLVPGGYAGPLPVAIEYAVVEEV